MLATARLIGLALGRKAAELGGKARARLRELAAGAGQRRRRLLPETVTETACDAIPFATTTSLPEPDAMPLGTSKFVETVALPVATPIVLWSCVRK
jgi:hypothetical protein